MEKDILSKLEVARLIALQRLGILPESEERRLSAWVERDEKNKAFYEQLRQKSFDRNATSPSTAEGWNLFEKKYRTGKKGSRPFRHTLYRMVASAAVLVLAITGTYYYLTQPKEEIITSPQPASAVQLVLENGNKITLDNPQSSVLALNNNVALHAEKQKIDYATTEKETVEIDEIYHTIIVPKYGEYTVRLSDKTTVKLNSESTLTYPVQFKGQERKIRLTGEAYLEADAHADAVQCGIHHIVLAGKHLGTAQNDAVDNDQGQEHAQCGVQAVHVGVHDHLDDGDEACDDDDVAGQMDLCGDHVAQQRDQDVGADQHEGEGCAHAQCAGDCRGNCQAGAGAQDQTQNGVLFDDAVGKDAYLGLLFLCHFLPTSFMPARCSS